MHCRHFRKGDWELMNASAFGKPVKLWMRKCKTCPKIWTQTQEERQER